ncbi:hypothetical protein DFH06DRAFT_1210594 [Mycena polygramma]|nr:hypothetical protein DFH06DRAFT_1210594 [Mycena polygramma]
MLPIGFLCCLSLALDTFSCLCPSRMSFRALISRPGQLTWSGKRKCAFPTWNTSRSSQCAKHNSSTGLTPLSSAFCYISSFKSEA